MKELTEVQQKYTQLLCDALQLFYKNDAKLLFNEPQENADYTAEKKEGKRIVNERAMVGCVYRYMWCLMQQAGSCVPVSDIDIEHDRMVKDDLEYYEKEISCECAQLQAVGRCERYGECIKVIVDKIHADNNGDDSMSVAIRKAVRPDIIVHNRNEGGVKNNGLVVEFKKDCKGISNSDIAFDVAKLYYFTCPQSKWLQYKLGAMVLLRPTCANVGIICDKKILSWYKVCAHDVREITDDEKIMVWPTLR